MYWPNAYYGWDDRDRPVKLAPSRRGRRASLAFLAVANVAAWSLLLPVAFDQGEFAVVAVPVLMTIMLLAALGLRSERFGFLIADRMAKGQCPQCLYEIDSGRREEDNAIVCPECGAAWKLGVAVAMREGRKAPHRGDGKRWKKGAGYKGWDDRRLPVKLAPTPWAWWLWRGSMAVGLVAFAGFMRALLVDHPFALFWMAPLSALIVIVLARIGQREHFHRLAPTRLSRGECPQCLYILDNVPPEEDNATVCPECGAAWVLPGKAKKG